MNTSSPLPPLSPLTQSGKGRSNVRIAVVSIILLHAVFFGGLLISGCDRKTAGVVPAATNDMLAATSTNALPGSAYPEPTNAPGLPGPVALSNTIPSIPWGTNPGAGAGPIGGRAVGTVGELPPVQPPAADVTEYAVKKGDTPAGIAKANGVTLQALMNANPGLDVHKLQIKQKIKLPAAARKPETAGGDTGGGAGGAGEPTAAAERLDTVKRGDTQTPIAKNHGGTVAAQRKANTLKTDRIHENQKLKLPAGAAPVPAPVVTPPSTAATGTLPAYGAVSNPTTSSNVPVSR